MARKWASRFNAEKNKADTVVDSKKKNLKPATLLSPLPVVLVSCCGLPGCEQNRPNLITIAWTGTVCSNPPMVSISVQPSRYSHQLIKQSGEFVINLVDSKLLKAADFCGVRSGRELDKFAACGLTAEAIPSLQHAPAVAESPLHLACKVKQILPLGSHDCFIAEVVAVAAAADLFTENGRLCLEKADLLSYMHGAYYRLAEPLGFFGYSVAAPDVLARRMPHRHESGHAGKNCQEEKTLRQTNQPGRRRRRRKRPGGR